jgi:hypothetical protein
MPDHVSAAPTPHPTAPPHVHFSKPDQLPTPQFNDKELSHELLTCHPPACPTDAPKRGPASTPAQTRMNHPPPRVSKEDETTSFSPGVPHFVQSLHQPGACVQTPGLLNHRDHSKTGGDVTRCFLQHQRCIDERADFATIGGSENFCMQLQWRKFSCPF